MRCALEALARKIETPPPPWPASPSDSRQYSRSSNTAHPRGSALGEASRSLRSVSAVSLENPFSASFRSNKQCDSPWQNNYHHQRHESCFRTPGQTLPILLGSPYPSLCRRDVSDLFRPCSDRGAQWLTGAGFLPLWF